MLNIIGIFVKKSKLWGKENMKILSENKKSAPE